MTNDDLATCRRRAVREVARLRRAIDAETGWRPGPAAWTPLLAFVVGLSSALMLRGSAETDRIDDRGPDRAHRT